MGHETEKQIEARAQAHGRAVTIRRRHLQPLFNTFDTILAPKLASGLLLAVSGGPDSRALMESVAHWRGRSGGHIVVGSIDHGLRPQAKDETCLVAARARILGFDSDVGHVTGSRKDEASLRQRRYRSLFQMAAAHQCQYVVTAHHADDQAEGFLMDTLGVGGGKGGAAMKSETAFEAGNLLRPFLTLHKSTLDAALTAIGCSNIVIDEADRRSQNKRSLVRNHLMHAIDAVQPGARARFRVKSMRRAEDEDALLTWAETIPVIPVEHGILIEDVHDIPTAVLRRLLMHQCQRLSSQDLRRGAKTLDILLSQVGTPHLERSYDLAGLRLFLSAQTIRITVHKEEKRR